MMKKQTYLTAILLSIFLCIPAYAGEFIQDGAGLWLRNEDGTWVTGWYQDGDGSWYNFDSSGYAREGWFQENGTRYYFRQSDKTMIADRTITLEGQIYQFDNNGAAIPLPGSYSGWMKDDNGWYYRLPNGTFVSGGWKQVKDNWYYFDEEGYMKTGVVTVDGIVYCLEESGAMVHDEDRVIGGVSYHFDSSGAGNVVWPYKMPLAIPPESEKTDYQKTVDAMADGILAGIINNNMSQEQKARAIYRWVKGHVRYSGYSPVGNWVSAANDGLRKRHGDCYTYYATSAELLNRAGIQTIEIIRSTDNNHYWNLVNIDGSWYHFDPCPRRTGGDFCLLTDAQIAGSKAHVFDRTLYPPTP